MATHKSITLEAADIQLASDMIALGARLQVLEAETRLSHDRLSRLYREMRGVSPPKGMLPFSVDWFMVWLPNIHASLFYNVYQFIKTHTPKQGVRAVIDAYRLYLEHAQAGQGDGSSDPVLSFTRAWMLMRFFDGGLLQLSTCTECGGQYIAHAHDPQKHYRCVICRPPPRAGKRVRGVATTAPAAVAMPATLAA